MSKRRLVSLVIAGITCKSVSPSESRERLQFQNELFFENGNYLDTFQFREVSIEISQGKFEWFNLRYSKNLL